MISKASELPDPANNEGWRFYADSKQKTGMIATTPGSHLSYGIHLSEKGSLTIGYLSSYESFTEVNVWLDKNKKITDESFCKADTKSIKDAQFIQINPIWEEKISQYNSMVIKNEKEEGDYFLHFCLPKNSGGKSEKFKILSIIWN